MSRGVPDILVPGTVLAPPLPTVSTILQETASMCMLSPHQSHPVLEGFPPGFPSHVHSLFRKWNQYLSSTYCVGWLIVTDLLKPQQTLWGKKDLSRFKDEDTVTEAKSPKGRWPVRSETKSNWCQHACPCPGLPRCRVLGSLSMWGAHFPCSPHPSAHWNMQNSIMVMNRCSSDLGHC